MNTIIRLAVVLGMLSTTAPALAAKSCDELKSDIASKIDAKGVKDYTLEIVAKGDASGGKTVGSCEGGAKQIVYRRG